ncbi:MAG: ion channel [Chroococcales cyanobacterium]
MQILLILIGITILVTVVVDVLITTLTLGGGGPLTSRISSWIWHGALFIHRKHCSHRFLAIVGWSMLIGIPLLWFILVWVGWTFIFSADEMAVVSSSTKLPANLWHRIYFTGYTISTLGLGDFEPKGIFWQICTSIASTFGFSLVTLMFAYLLPVVSSGTRKRQLAVYIATLGGTPDEIVTRAWNGDNFGQFDQHLINLTSQLVNLGETHLNYPVLHYFHSLERSRANALSVVALDEALTLLQYGVSPSHHPDSATLDPARRAIAAYLNTIESAYFKSASETPPLPSVELLRKHGIPTVSDRQFLETTKALTHRRQLLLALIEHDGWNWDAIASSHTTNRACHLDDSSLVDQVILH